MKKTNHADASYLDFTLGCIVLGTVLVFLCLVSLVVLPFRFIKFVLWGRA